MFYQTRPTLRGLSALHRWKDFGWRSWRRASQPFTNRVTFEWLDELPFEDMLRRIAKLPPRSAVFFGDIRVDAAGVPLDHERALARLRKATSAPIFSYVDSYLGQGIVGGPLLSTEELGRRMAAIAVRILSGEMPENIRPPPLRSGAAIYDWRELTHWKISEARLPPESIVRFRELTTWERYGWHITSILLALLVQSAMITWLLVERLGRRRAETRSRTLSLEAFHLNRAAEAGALSASFAHDLGQPTLSIALNAQRAGTLLNRDCLELDKIKEAVIEISRANDHAAAIIKQSRNLLKRRRDPELQKKTELNAVIADALGILSTEANHRQVVLRAEVHKWSLLVSADPVHLLQVVLNLATNAMDAMTDNPPDARRVVFRTALLDQSTAEVAVID